MPLLDIERLYSWADNFSKVSPIIEALGVLAIPFVILAFEFRQAKRQQRFEERVIFTQADVRQQQAVREYLSQIMTIHLESDQGEKLRENKELQKLLEANTHALFNELSVREDSRKDSNGDRVFDSEAIAKDRKGQVVEFLSDLSWIKGTEDKKPLVSLSKANLEGANLEGASLDRVNLSTANLFRADLEGAVLFRANLFRADLKEADLKKTNLSRADLKKADLEGADLEGAILEGADLGGAYLNDVKNLSNIQIKLVCDWDQAIYTDATIDKSNLSYKFIPKDKQANQIIIESIRQDNASDPEQPPNCR